MVCMKNRCLEWGWLDIFYGTCGNLIYICLPSACHLKFKFLNFLQRSVTFSHMNTCDTYTCDKLHVVSLSAFCLPLVQMHSNIWYEVLKHILQFWTQESIQKTYMKKILAKKKITV